MSRVTSRAPQAVAMVRAAVIDALYQTAQDGAAFLKTRTPVRTGTAQRSQHGLVLDESGTPARTPGTDENGKTLPTYAGTGKLTAIVGSNCGYYRWVDQGARGRTGSGALAQTLTEMEQRWAENKRKAGLR